MNKNNVRAGIFGILSSLGFAPTYLIFIFFFSFNFFLGELVKQDRRESCFLLGWWFGFGYFLGNCYWLVSPLTFEFPKYVILIPFSITLVPAILGCYIGLISVILNVLIKKYNINNNFYIALMFSVLWGFMEIIRSYFFIGFPWNLIAYSWGFHRIMFQFVNLIGTFGLCFIVSFTYTMFFVLKQNKKYYWIYCLLLLSNILFGSIRLYEEKLYDNNKLNLKVRVIQPNFSQQEKQNKTNIEKQLNYIINTINDSNDNKINLLIFPETAIPNYIIDKDSYTIDKIMSSIISNKQTIVSGVVRYDFENVYNSLIVFNKDEIIDYYDKYYLAPFGEYIPYSKLLPKFITAFVGTGFTRGKDKAKVFNNVFANVKISPIICYESLFPTAINKNTDLIINITNDIWFGKTSASYQHFTALKFRVVENNIPAIRSANSGISAYINRYGNVIKSTKLNRTDFFDVEL